jgi:hypothetical protein
MKYNYIKFCEATQLIKEGDVLLFRNSGFVPYLIKTATQGPYTHVGLASWVYDKVGDPVYLECVEFREWKGGRAVNLSKQVEFYNKQIDVYRASSPFLEFIFEDGKIIQTEIHFDGRVITNCLRKVTGIPYGWRRIWWLGKHHFLGTRLWLPTESDDDTLQDSVVYPVCSTVVAHCYHKHFTDLIHNRSNARTEPSDIARSPILNYLFTLER